MGLFNFNKKKKSSDVSMKTMMIDNSYFIAIPEDWQHYKSDRFRTRSKDKKIDFSITNYGKQISVPDDYGIESLKKQFLPLFNKFINEGGYISNNDQEIGEDFIYQSFKMDNENQYYYYTSRVIRNDLRVLIAFIIRQDGEYKTDYKTLIRKIGKSITLKIA